MLLLKLKSLSNISRIIPKSDWFKVLFPINLNQTIELRQVEIEWKRFNVAASIKAIFHLVFQTNRI